MPGGEGKDPVTARMNLRLLALEGKGGRIESNAWKRAVSKSPSAFSPVPSTEHGIKSGSLYGGIDRQVVGKEESGRPTLKGRAAKASFSTKHQKKTRADKCMNQEQV